MNSDMDIVGRLGSPVAEERQEARESLESLGPRRAISVLLDALGDERWRIRKTAMEALEAYPDSHAVIDALIQLLGEASDAQQRNAAIELLTRMEHRAVPAILRAITDDDPHVRKLSADILGQTADPRAEKPLISALNDSEENVRMAAAEALGNYKSRSSFEALLNLLDGPDLTLKFCAMESLAHTGREIPVEKIRSLVDQNILRRAAFDALGNSSSAEAARILVEGLNDSSPSSRHAAIRSLGNIYINHPHNHTTIDEYLKKTAQSDGLLDLLTQALYENNPEVQKGALRLLGALRHPGSLPHILEAARNGDLEHDAIEALKLFAERHMDTLLKYLPPEDDPLHDLLNFIIRPSLKSPVMVLDRPFTPATSEMTDEQFDLFRNYLHDFCGIHFKDEMKFILEKRLLRRIEALHISTFREYLNLVMNTSAGKHEIWEAINILTTNETYFFREKFQLKAFSEEILPLIHMDKERSGMRRLRVLSAGCSSGEEPYTLAILIDESGLFSGWDVRIVGGDISEQVLEKAREGIYRSGAFRSAPPDYIKQYFVEQGNESWRIIDRMKSWVEFRHINLFERYEVESIGPFDVIFCRNVIIYFDLMAKRQVIESLHNSLLPGGFLMLGHSESLVNISARFDLVHLKHDMVYRKPQIGGRLA